MNGFALLPCLIFYLVPQFVFIIKSAPSIFQISKYTSAYDELLHNMATVAAISNNIPLDDCLLKNRSKGLKTLLAISFVCFLIISKYIHPHHSHKKPYAISVMPCFIF